MEINVPPDAGNKLPDKPPATRPSKPIGLLAWIAGYKLIKAAIAILGGIALYHLGNQNLVATGHRWLIHVGLDPEGKLGTNLLHRLGHFDPSRIYWTVAIFFAYAVIYCVEAVGLFLEKRWAEWLTVFQTAILVPFELYEMAVRPGPIKASALCLSIGVILYLVWRIREDDPADAGLLPRQ